MRILVTGGAGFIGSHLVERLLLEPGNQVVTLDRLSYAGSRANLAFAEGNPRHRLETGDIADRALVDALLKAFQPEAVVHLAAETHVDRSIEGPGLFVWINVGGTVALLESTRQYWTALPEPRRSAFRFLHVSTDEIHGSLGPTDPPFTENAPLNPRSPYSASKAAADHFVRACHATWGLPCLIAAPCNAYGPRQYPEKLIPLAILKVLRGEPIPLYGDGHQIRDWIYVGDLAKALEAALSGGVTGETYLISARQPRSNRTLLEGLCALLDQLHPSTAERSSQTLITPVTDRPGHDFRYESDPAKFEATTGWHAETKLEVGLEITVDWYRRNQAWWTEALERGRYQLERLGLTDR